MSAATIIAVTASAHLLACKNSPINECHVYLNPVSSFAIAAVLSCGIGEIVYQEVALRRRLRRNSKPSSDSFDRN